MQASPSISREPIRFAVPMLIAQLALMANAVIDTHYDRGPHHGGVGFS